MNAAGKSALVLMIVIAVTSLVLRFAVNQIITLTIAQNESNAAGILKMIGTALENYAGDNNNVFPGSIKALTVTNPPYLNRDYISESPLRGYTYTCSRLEPIGFSCSAAPIKCNLSGKKIFVVSTGNIFVSEDCFKKE
jgi:type II secretory pathway pseudopilin PulG